MEWKIEGIICILAWIGQCKGRSDKKIQVTKILGKLGLEYTVDEG